MLARFFNYSFLTVLLLASSLHAQGLPNEIVVNPHRSTSPVVEDADDPAIWIHPTTPAQSLIIGTDKGNFPNGGLFVWNVDGSLHQRLNINHPNNVDVRYGMQLQSGLMDIAAVSLRDDNEIRVYKIDPVTRTLADLTTAAGIPVFSDPYGIALYKRPADGAIYAVVSSSASAHKTLWQLLLTDDGTSKVRGTRVREFAPITDLVEGLVADDALGFLYVSEEGLGVHKFYADPDRGNTRLALFATDDSITGEREGIAIYQCGDSTGYLLLSSQGDNNVKVYAREGAPGNPHQHNLLTTIVTNGATQTDGLDVTSRATRAEFPYGFLITHNSPGKNFQLYSWENIAQTHLKICSSTVGNIGEPAGIPVGFKLEQNHPNPFIAATNIRYEIIQAGYVTLTVYNLIGQEIRRLVDMPQAQGSHIIQWDGLDTHGRPAPDGVYFYRITFNAGEARRKMVLLHP
ncbi:MAG: phytase [bacterium]